MCAEPSRSPALPPPTLSVYVCVLPSPGRLLLLLLLLLLLRLSPQGAVAARKQGLGGSRGVAQVRSWEKNTTRVCWCQGHLQRHYSMMNTLQQT